MASLAAKVKEPATVLQIKASFASWWVENQSQFNQFAVSLVSYHKMNPQHARDPLLVVSNVVVTVCETALASAGDAVISVCLKWNKAQSKLGADDLKDLKASPWFGKWIPSRRP